VSTAGIQDWQLARVQSHTSEGMRSPEDLALDHMPDVGVTDALSPLPGEFRMAVCLADVEGFAYREMAGIMHCPVGTRDVAAASRPEPATRASRGNAQDRRRAKQGTCLNARYAGT
jgi:RNA polymerase sigma-70 factor (ECF subfamily)